MNKDQVKELNEILQKGLTSSERELNVNNVNPNRTRNAMPTQAPVAPPEPPKQDQ